MHKAIVVVILFLVCVKRSRSFDSSAFAQCSCRGLVPGNSGRGKRKTVTYLNLSPAAASASTRGISTGRCQQACRLNADAVDG